MLRVSRSLRLLALGVQVSPRVRLGCTIRQRVMGDEIWPEAHDLVQGDASQEVRAAFLERCGAGRTIARLLIGHIARLLIVL